MKKLLTALSALGLLVFGLTACTGGGGGGSNFQIISCTLGCSGSGTGGDGQVSCGIQDVFVNGELRIAFNAEVDPDSLSVFTVQVTQLGTGKTPAADRFVDPDDPNIMVYRPKLSFDSTGAPVFGLASGASYTIKLPGIEQDAGSQYVRNINGTANRHRMLCTVLASLGVQDLKPGAPSVDVTVDKVTAYDPITGEPSAFAEDIPASGETDVYRFSQVVMTFDDVMNPATLVNPVTGASPSIKVKVDPDGITSDPSDQEELEGVYTILLDQNELKTTVSFTSELGFPSAGSDPINKRKIVVTMLPSISDLGGNPLSNTDDVVFTPEFVAFEELSMAEDFATVFNEDVAGSGGDWGQQIAGVLRPGIAGGSGRLGHLFLDQGETLVLNTDFEDFSGITSELTFSPANVLDATFDGTDFVFPPVTDGLFEFASLRLNSGSKLQFTGSQPARVLVRGELLLQGVIDVSGGNALEHDDTEVFGQTGGAGGPGGGKGGDGGRLPNWVGFEALPGTIVPDPPVTPPLVDEINGQDGEGVPDNLLAPTGTYGFGEGGLRWPSPTVADPQYHLPVDPTDVFGTEWDIILVCQTKMKGGVGGGGAHALSGGEALNKPAPGGGFTPPESPNALGGDAADFGLGIGSDPLSPQRTLDPEAGYLHGGGGGGGGGGHIRTATTNGKVFQDCLSTASGTDSQIVSYAQRSAPAGGGGGGGIQVQAGRRAVIDGRIDASGGIGGSKTQAGDGTAGGAGAGGAILLQSPLALVASSNERLDVSGGVGGFGVGASLGGDGGSGLLRYEVSAPVPLLADEAPKLAPSEAELAAVGATLEDVFSFGELVTQVSGPGSLSGVQSCWMRPPGNFFVLTFLEDDVDELGWDLTLVPNPPSLGDLSFRGDNPLFSDPLIDLLGNDLGTSPLVVRFQGARAIKQIDNFCNVDIDGEDSKIAAGTLTGWVGSPAELNTYFADPAKRPNMIRFKILFDRSNAFTAALGGVRDITMRVLPD